MRIKKSMAQASTVSHIYRFECLRGLQTGMWDAIIVLFVVTVVELHMALSNISV